jgi:N6-L-threonylcarbamoyladenine synthase
VVLGVGRYRRLGTTLDDALGEAYDKAAKMLGLGFPGGPAVERAAREGDPSRFALPRPMIGQPGCNFSFSGLKTALRQTIERLGPDVLEHPTLNDLCASFQAAVAEVLLDRTRRAAALFRAKHPGAGALVVAGGVAANAHLRACLATLADEQSLHLIVPPPALCTDNGVMIAWAGLERLGFGLTDDLGAPARARWPLDPAAEPAPGARVKA